MRAAQAALAALALAVPLRAQAPEVRAVRLTTLDFRTTLRFVTSEDVPPAEVVRDGGEVVVRIAGAALEGLPLPALEEPIETIRLEREPGRTVVRVGVAPEVPFEARHEPGLLTVVFGEQPAPELRGPVTPELHRELFRTGTVDRGPVEDESPGRAGEEGLVVGRVILRPYVTASWVDADVLAFDNPVPARDRYLQVAPGVTASVPVGNGLLAAEYEPRLRFFSDSPVVNQTSHLAGVRIEMPIGSRSLVRLAHRFTTAILETTVVDPGREYFFDLSRFTFNETSAAARVDLGARLYAEGEAAVQWTRFDEARKGGFFDYDTRTLRAGLGYDVVGDLRATVSYSYERIPPSPDRAIVESNAHSLLGTLAGPLTALTAASLTAGFRSQTNPLATGESASFRGLTLGASLRRELGRATVLDLLAARTPEPSAYDTNAYYVTNSLGAVLTVPLPVELWGRGSVTWIRNDYPNDAPSLSGPRRDDILGWTVGLGRTIGWRSWVRADYRRERRDSNLPGYGLTTDGFVVQLGAGLVGSGPRP